ncbi:hypothetical protein OSB04_017476 [Centaurea solstitialis]|uniref:MULE transposase domain-containing protein n=1 Tax=Centaurea solstitialis TaxID=347529 RepID=A0AA38WM21_9ASTR|nr:hypothetical protein OSB04_017476 [Centaurea solstitialis]
MGRGWSLIFLPETGTVGDGFPNPDGDFLTRLRWGFDGAGTRTDGDGDGYYSPHYYPPPFASLDVPDGFKVEVGMEFDSLEAAEELDVRRSNRKRNIFGNVQTRFMVCSKEGAPPNKDFDSMTLQQGERKHRNSNVKRQGIHVTKDNKQYEIYHFFDRHNHPLLNSLDKRILRVNRQFKYTDYVKVIRGSSANIGASTLHKMEAYLQGGYQYIGAINVDYQNARRDVVSFVGHKDAKTFVDLLEKRQLTVPEFFVEYKCLQCIFWADEICHLNYKEFGDSISIDDTHLTDMYDSFEVNFGCTINTHVMVFLPFTAIDNHKKSVIVGSAFMYNEKVPTYEWVLSTFLKCHGKQPLFVMTDQCSSLKEAIHAIFTQSNHRLCMWHIMKNMRGRVRADLKENSTF